MIKFLDLYKQDKILHKKILKKISNLFKNGDFILGKEVQIFENEFSKFCGSKYAISCANGTDALTLALKSLNLPINSEVIIPAMTYCSTAFSVVEANLKPVLVDIGYLSSTICTKDLRKKINKKTKVILPVHLHGSVANLKEIREIIKGKKIFLIDDCAQAHGAYDDTNTQKKKIGSTTDISCFSLYPGKNLGAYGDAGIITTNNLNLFKRLRKLRNLGSEKKFKHEFVGMNSRLDTIQAIVLNEKLKKLSNNNSKRRKIANFYNQNISNPKIQKLKYSKSCVFHQYVILTKKREKLIKLLNKNKIQYGFHYPNAIHQLDVFKKLLGKNKFKNAEKLAKDSISIPIDPNLKSNDIKRIVKVLNNF